MSVLSSHDSHTALTARPSKRGEPGETVDVIVVGAGPTGLTLACELLRRGATCRVLERLPKVGTTSRAFGIQPRTLEVFDVMGLIEQITELMDQARARAGTGPRPAWATAFRVKDRAILRRPVAKVNPLQAITPYRGGWLPQTEVERVLFERLQSLGGSVDRSCELSEIRQSDDGVVAVAGDREFRGKWLVGCDGGRSGVRRAIDVHFESTAHAQDLLLGDVDLSWDPAPSAEWWQPGPLNVWMSPDGPLSVLRVPLSPQWRIMAAVPSSSASSPPIEATAEVLQKLLSERTGDTTVKIERAHWLSSWKISERLVPRYRKGRVLPAGDAVHTHSPVGGQGMNTGIQDANNLGWKLAAVVSGQASASLLDTYESERRPVAHSVLDFSGGLTQLLIGSTFGWRFLRDQVVLRFLKFERWRQFALRRASQIWVNYRSSPLSVSEGSFLVSAPRAGDRVPYAECVIQATGAKTTIWRELRNGKWILFVFLGSGDLDVASAASINALQSEDVVVHIVSRSNVTTQLNRAATLIDAGGDVHRTFGVQSPAMFIIRPDGYTGYRGQTPNADRARDYVSRALGSPSERVTG
jgi:2-polyprenyl-6-methoxyphenol hydroxylase-like FAD-dependent oxidoreductase